MAGTRRELKAARARWLLTAAVLYAFTGTLAVAQETAPAASREMAPAPAVPAGDDPVAPPGAVPADLSVPAEPLPAALAAPAEAEGGAPAEAGPATISDADNEPIAEELSLPKGLSPWRMFQQADIVVRAVMVGLALASVVTWTVLFAKGVEFLLATRRLHRGFALVSQAPDLATADQILRGRRGPATAMVRAAMHEGRASTAALPRGGGAGLLQRVASHLGRIEHQAGRRLNAGTGVLATIGATSPFVGLFGTVWGIMNSFIGISEAQTTNLAVVAPGIAEALLATAMGLVTAIPAVVVYNVFARWSAAYRAHLADAAAVVERLVSRDLDHDRIGRAAFAQAAE